MILQKNLNSHHVQLLEDQWASVRLILFRLILYWPLGFVHCNNRLKDGAHATKNKTKMDEKILAAARRVARIQAEFDGADHDTTTAGFMQEHGISWLLRRDQIMREISGRRTEAIWALGRVV